MTASPQSLRERICAYYGATVDSSYLPNWSGAALSFHFGLADESTPSLTEAHAATNARVAELARIRAGMTVLDAGCGIGGTSIWIAQHRRAKVTGITIDPHQVELARGFAKERGVDDLVEFHCIDYAATGLAPSSFDVVFNLESFCHAHDPKAYVAHAFSLLKSGGRFVCVDMFRGSAGDPAHARAMCDGWVLPSLRSIEETLAIVSGAGFVGVEREDLTRQALRPAAALKAAAERQAFRMRVEREFASVVPNPYFEGHILGGIGAAEGMESGSVTYGYVGGRKP